jgi:hypothetical protein
VSFSAACLVSSATRRGLVRASGECMGLGVCWFRARDMVGRPPGGVGELVSPEVHLLGN